VPKINDASVLALLRIATGALVFLHGIRKVITGPVTAIGKTLVAHGFPAWFAYVVAAGELCGLLLALGISTRLAAAVVALTLWGIIFIVQLPLLAGAGTGRGVPLEYPVLLALTVTLFVIAPPSKWSFRRGR
jgi:uncharacterized membrane protein YphA (DoxX/SURF4 family)